MTRILALESSTTQCSVALLCGDELVQRIAPGGARNSEFMLPLVQALLAESGTGLRQLDALAFGAGPGAFTGLRVACGVAQGLAFGAGLPVLPVGTLEALAETQAPVTRQPAGQRLLAALDARMQQCYWAELRSDGVRWRIAHGPLLAAPDQVPQPVGADWLAAGDGFSLFAAALDQRLGAVFRRVQDCARQPEAAAVARLAAVDWSAGLAVAPEAAQPVYVRDKVALTTREREAR